MKKKFETSKLILWFGEIFFDILVRVSKLTSVTFIKAGIENKSKGRLAITKVSNLKLNDFITILSGLLSGSNSYNTAEALNSVLQSIQTVINNHSMDSENNTMSINTDNIQQENMKSKSTNMGENLGEEQSPVQNNEQQQG